MENSLPRVNTFFLLPPFEWQPASFARLSMNNESLPENSATKSSPPPSTLFIQLLLSRAYLTKIA